MFSIAQAIPLRHVRRYLEQGKRTRVRLGPFASREDADKAADKAKQLDFTPAVLTL
jgi:cell division protein FtsN